VYAHPMSRLHAERSGPRRAWTPVWVYVLTKTMHDVAPLTLTRRTPTVEATHDMPTQAALVANMRRVLAVKVTRQAQGMQQEARQNDALPPQHRAPCIQMVC
jgi:hypothetical protein